MPRMSAAGSAAWARPGSAVSIRVSEPRSPTNAEVKTSSRAPAARSSDSTAERRFIRDAHSGVTKSTRSNASPVTPTRKVAGAVRSGAALQQHPYDLGAAGQGG